MKQNGKVLELLTQFEKMGTPGMDCAVFHQGKCVFRRQAGYSDEAGQKPMNGRERFNIYSCSKPITCTAALQLVENGTIGLDDAVADYLPEFRHLTKIRDGKIEPVRTPMTIRHLFTMTAGLTYNTGSENIRRGQIEKGGRLSTRDAMKYLAQDPLNDEPGGHWEYSLCHDVLAAVVEVASGERFGEYVRKNIFDRAGMTRSTFQLPDVELGEIAAQYRYNAEKQQYVFIGPNIQCYKLGSEYESGGAGCVSTLDDYTAFLESLRSGKLLRHDTLATMIRPQISEEAAKTFWFPDYAYGLGVRCPKSPDHGPRDFGWGGAAGAFLAVFPKEEAFIFYIQHVLASPVQALRIKLAEAALEDLRG